MIFSKRVLSAVIVFILPIVDTTTVTINRMMRGQSPFVGGRDHTTHHLSYAGLTDRHVAIVFCAISSVSMCLAIAVLHFINNWNYITIYLFGTYCVLLFSVLFYLTKRKKKEDKK
jgi:UDP-GlcNAc:undecaprenyl-phosphate/decaprenyl-phosphate GlcNAc-1-phosphate transferase